MDCSYFGYMRRRQHIKMDAKQIKWMVYSERRSKTIGSMIKPEWVAHLLGITLNGLTGEPAKHMLREKKVWPYYYNGPNQLNDWDRFPTELLPENLNQSNYPEEKVPKSADKSLLELHSSNGPLSKKLFSGRSQ